MSSFRLICTATLIVAMAGFVAGAAAAQSAIATDQSGKAYLAGLRPPHEQHNPAHAKTSDKNGAAGIETPANGGGELEASSAGAPCRENKFPCRVAER